VVGGDVVVGWILGCGVADWVIFLDFIEWTFSHITCFLTGRSCDSCSFLNVMGLCCRVGMVRRRQRRR
jgi:hypothetical protein